MTLHPTIAQTAIEEVATTQLLTMTTQSRKWHQAVVTVTTIPAIATTTTTVGTATTEAINSLRSLITRMPIETIINNPITMPRPAATILLLLLKTITRLTNRLATKTTTTPSATAITTMVATLVAAAAAIATISRITITNSLPPIMIPILPPIQISIAKAVHHRWLPTIKYHSQAALCVLINPRLLRHHHLLRHLLHLHPRPRLRRQVKHIRTGLNLAALFMIQAHEMVAAHRRLRLRDLQVLHILERAILGVLQVTAASEVSAILEEEEEEETGIQGVIHLRERGEDLMTAVPAQHSSFNPRQVAALVALSKSDEIQSANEAKESSLSTSNTALMFSKAAELDQSNKQVKNQKSKRFP